MTPATVSRKNSGRRSGNGGHKADVNVAKDGEGVTSVSTTEAVGIKVGLTT